ncbi:MAG: tetratricopeptide repeat protein, partial [Tunicatimonas sp.]|uniref:tetratricopeptide repeat protein n=1 Tax=Tunicatimonas sp. TaxID=1940096 RepID=UPI003C774B15
YFRRALSLDQQIGNVQEVDGTLFNLGSNFYKTEEYDSAEFYWNSVINRTDTTADSPMLDAIFQNLGALATTQEQWHKAEQYYRQALQRYQRRGNHEGTASLHESLSNLYNQQQKYELARQEARKGLAAVDEDLRVRSLLHVDLAEAYEGLSQYQSAAESYRTYATLRDSLLGQEKVEAIAEMEARYQNEQQKRELAIQDQKIELLNQSAKIRQLERNLLVAGLLSLLLIGFFVIRIQRQKVNRKQTQLKNSQALLASVKENAYLKEQRLLQELEHRNQQLTSYTLNFVQKNELMNNVRQQVDELQKQKQWTSRDFRRIKMHIQQHVSIDQDWEHFRLHFESVHPDFFHNLTESFDNLGSKELRLCALIRLNMSIKESATVLGISPDSVKTARHRLRKKMNLNGATSMLEALMQIEKGRASSQWKKAS